MQDRGRTWAARSGCPRPTRSRAVTRRPASRSSACSAFSPRPPRTRDGGVAAIGVGFVIGALIGASRVVLNVDYASDVLAGAALGLASLAFCLFVNRHRRRRGGAPPPAREASPAHGDMSARRPAGRIALVAVTDDRPVADQLAELGAQLAWVRDYL